VQGFGGCKLGSEPMVTVMVIVMVMVMAMAYELARVLVDE
jgi:hypothetical protein